MEENSADEGVVACSGMGNDVPPTIGKLFAQKGLLGWR